MPRSFVVSAHLLNKGEKLNAMSHLLINGRQECMKSNTLYTFQTAVYFGKAGRNWKMPRIKHLTTGRSPKEA